jgi:PAS domain S-box-containing protein
MRYISANPAYAGLAGLPVEEIVGRPIVEVMGQEAFEAVLPYVNRVLEGERVEYEAELPWRAHGPSWLHVVYTPSKKTTERSAARRAQTALQQAQKNGSGRPAC